LWTIAQGDDWTIRGRVEPLDQKEKQRTENLVPEEWVEASKWCMQCMILDDD
jgi:hypothetical protein